MVFVVPPRAGERAARIAAPAAALVLALAISVEREARAETPASTPPVAATPPAADPATAPPEPPASRAWETEAPKYRGGFAMGLSLGFGLGSIAGYPNDVTKIGYARNYTVTGLRPSGGGGLWLGGALTDWFTFGVGVQGGRLLATGTNKTSVGGLIFHMEGYPLFSLGGRWRDVGVMLDAGTGTVSVTPESPSNAAKLVDSGSASLVGGGVFWEIGRLWLLRGGPFVSADYYWSESVRRPAIFLGWRTALYTSP